MAVDFSARKIGDQLKTAEKKGIYQVLIVGENELKSRKFNLKNLNTGKEQTVAIAEIIKQLKKRI